MPVYYYKMKLKKAAKMMAQKYKSNDELTVFTSLDVEDFKH